MIRSRSLGMEHLCPRMWSVVASLAKAMHPIPLVFSAGFVVGELRLVFERSFTLV